MTRPPFVASTASRTAIAAATLAIVAAAFPACKSEPPKETTPQPAALKPGEIDPTLLQAFQPLPTNYAGPNTNVPAERIHLGYMLYYEARLSKNHDISCNSCHMLNAFGVDGKATSPGHRGQLGARNSPTVYNAAGHFAQFWDARAKDVEEQALGPVLNPVEMAMPDPSVVEKTLASMPEYVELFKKAFPGEAEPVTFDNMGKAIGAFERQLATPARWDSFLAGNRSALNEIEREGFKTFVSMGCVSCHSGPLIGGQTLQKAGLVEPWPSEKDLGRYEITKMEQDRYYFKVPSLRNVEKTAPYFHDGSVASLEEAVRIMARHQLAKKLTDAEVASIVAWLKTLTGNGPEMYSKAPTLPASTAATPKPDPS